MKFSYPTKRIPILTSRELEILELIVAGYSTKQIADTLYLGFETIKTHRSRLFIKLDVKNVAGLVREAIFNNLIHYPLRLAQ